jgi:hypothetical protein
VKNRRIAAPTFHFKVGVQRYCERVFFIQLSAGLVDSTNGLYLLRALFFFGFFALPLNLSVVNHRFARTSFYQQQGIRATGHAVKIDNKAMIRSYDFEVKKINP